MLDNSLDIQHETAPAFAPEAVYDTPEEAQSWAILRGNVDRISTDAENKIATIPFPATEGLSQARLHQLARIRYTVSRNADPAPTRTGHFEAALDTARLDAMLEEWHGSPMGQRLDDLDWEHYQVPAKKKDQVRFLASNWAQRQSPALQLIYPHLWLGLDPTERAAIYEAMSELNDLVVRGRDTLEWRERWGSRLADLFDPEQQQAAPPTAPERLNKETQEKVEQATSGQSQVDMLPDDDEDDDNSDDDEEESESPSNSQPSAQSQQFPPKSSAPKPAVQLPGLKDEVYKDPEISLNPSQLENLSHLGKMEIHDHVVQKRRTRVVRRVGGAGDRGIAPTHMHRWALDKQVFNIKRAGGTILIDTSGSMHWDLNVLSKLIDRLPGLTIAGHCGGVHAFETQEEAEEFYAAHGNIAFCNRNEAYKKSYTGRLCIYGKKGRWAPFEGEEYGHSGANAVDYEAAQWLAAMPEPRIWITDEEWHSGAVAEALGERGYRPDSKLVAMVKRVVRRNKIQIARGPREAMQRLGIRDAVLDRLVPR